MANAPRDENNVPALLATSSADGFTPVPVYANPTTHRLIIDAAGSGVTGPGSSTDNAIVRWDATTGAAIQNSTIILSDTGVFSGSSNVPYISTGTAAPATTPGKPGDIFVDTTHTKVYIATGSSSSADWTIMN